MCRFRMHDEISIPGIPMKNVHPTSLPISLKDASGGWIVTTHEGEIDIPGLPEAAQKAQICPQLAHTSLVSIKSLVNAGYKVTFTKYKCRVQYKGSLARATRSLNKIMDPTIKPRRTRSNQATEDITKAMDEYSQAIKPRTSGQQRLTCHDKIRVDKVLASSSIQPSERNTEESNWKWTIHNMARTYSRSSREASTTPFTGNRQRAYELTKERHPIDNKARRRHIHTS